MEFFSIFHYEVNLMIVLFNNELLFYLIRKINKAFPTHRTAPDEAFIGDKI